MTKVVDRTVTIPGDETDLAEPKHSSILPPDTDGPSAATYARAVRRLAKETRGIVAILVVALFAAEFAHWFREAIFWFVGTAYGKENSTEAMAAVRIVLPVVFITLGILLSRRINLAAESLHSGRIGLAPIEKAAHGSGSGPSLRGTIMKAASTLAACMPGTSLGRESAILETSGVVGFSVARWFRVDAVELACAGIAAAFASAYHAPFGAMAYVGGHVGVARRPRAMIHAAIGALVGDWITVEHLGGHPIFPGSHAAIGTSVVLGLIAVVPALVGSRLFVRVREGMPALRVVREHPVVFVVAGIAVSVTTVLIAPLSAGNGMEAIRHVAVTGSIAAACSLGIGKLLATSATLGAKAPGGVFAPTLAVSAGWILATYVGLEAMGVNLPGNHWDGIVIGMAAGLSVGLHAPVLAGIVVAEMSGQLSLMPFTMAAALIAHVIVRAVDRTEKEHDLPVPQPMHTEDA